MAFTIYVTKYQRFRQGISFTNKKIIPLYIPGIAL